MPDAGGFTIHDPPPAVWIDDGDWSEDAIPPRPWVAPNYLLRGAITMLSGAASASKSTVAVGYAIALALHRELGAFQPVAPMRVSVLNCEDDRNEQRRRFSAALRQFGATPAALIGKVARLGPEHVGTLLERDDIGRLVATPAMAQLEQHVARFRPDVLILDPLVELHSLEENDNTAVRSVMARFRSMAQQHDMAVVLVHHARKGAGGTPGDPDSLRGASAIVGAARIVLTVAGMTEDEARAFGLPPEHHRQFFRVDGAKSNYAGLTTADWFERAVVQLDNGDSVAAPVPWQPPEDSVSLEQRIAIKAGIEAGSPVGPWSPRLGDEARSVRRLLEQHGLSRKPSQQAVLAELELEGYRPAKFKDANYRVISGLRGPDGQPHSANWVADPTE